MEATLYVDSSALVKLVLPEAETEALRAVLSGADRLVASVVILTEVRLAAARERGDEGAAAAEAVVEIIHLLALDRAIAAAAGRLHGLRTLDAVHLATALSLRSELDGLVTYDRRLARAAREHGLDVLAPTAPER